MSRSRPGPRAPPQFSPAPHPRDSPNPIRHSLRYTDLYNIDTLGERVTFPRRPALSNTLSITHEVDEHSNSTVSSDEEDTRSSSSEQNKQNKNHVVKDSNFSQERVKVTDQASILTVENLTAFTPNLTAFTPNLTSTKSESAYFSLETVATERSEPDIRQIKVQKLLDIGAKPKSPPPAVAPRPKSIPYRTKHLSPPQNHGSPEVIELQVLKNPETNEPPDSDCEAASEDDIQNDREDNRKRDISLAYHKSDPGPPVKISSQEITDQDYPKRNSTLMYHPSDPGPPPGHLLPADVHVLNRSPKLPHQSLTRNTDRSNQPKPYDSLSLRSLGGRRDQTMSLRSLNRGLGSSSESTVYDVRDHREIILDSYLLPQNENHHLIPIFDPDTTESKATDNEGFYPKPPSPPRDRRPSEPEIDTNYLLYVQDKFVPEIDHQSEPVRIVPSISGSIMGSEGVFITVEEEHYDFSVDFSDAISIVTPQPVQPPPYSQQSDPPSTRLDNQEDLSINDGGAGRQRSCCCIIIGLSVVLFFIAGIAVIATFFLLSADTGTTFSSTGTTGLVSLGVLVIISVITCVVVICCRRHKRSREKDPNIHTDCEIAQDEKDDSIDPDIQKLQHDSSEDIYPSRYNNEHMSTTTAEVYQGIQDVQHICMTTNNISGEPKTDGFKNIEKGNNTNSGEELLLSECEVVPVKNDFSDITASLNTKDKLEGLAHERNSYSNTSQEHGTLLHDKEPTIQPYEPLETTSEVVEVKNDFSYLTASFQTEDKLQGLACKGDTDSEISQEYGPILHDKSCEILEKTSEQKKSLKQKFGVLMESLIPRRKGKKRKHKTIGSNKNVSIDGPSLISMRPKQSTDDPISSVKQEDQTFAFSDVKKVENGSNVKQEATVLEPDVNVNKESLTVPVDVTFEQNVKQRSSYSDPRYISTAAENIGVKGGIVHLPDVDVSLKIPADALPPKDLVNICLTVDTNEEHPAIQEDQLIFGQVITCKPDGLKFLKPVTLSVPFSGVNISEHCLQVWCKSDGEEAVWEKIYDGSQDHADNTVRVLVNENTIKLRVGHFTAFSFITVPICSLWNWLNKSPEQLLEITAYLDPAEVATSKLVGVRVYAIQTTDFASKKLIEQYEEKNGDSGMCSVPSGFVLKANGKNLSVVLKNIAPKQKWLPNGSMAGCITYKNIQNGGQENGFPVARWDILFLLNDDVDQADSFVASFDLSQEENAESEVKGIVITDKEARRNRNHLAQNPQTEDMQQRVNYLPIHDHVDRLRQHAPEPAHKVYDRSVRRKQNRAENVPREIAAPRSAVELDKRMLEQPIIRSRNELQDHQPFSNIATGFGTSDGSVCRKRHIVPENTDTHKAFHTSSSSQSLQANHRGKSAISDTSGTSHPFTTGQHQQHKCLHEDDLRSFIVPVSITFDQNTAASSQPKRLDGDCGPFLKTMARKITSRWKNVAKILDFTPEECKDFERKSTIDLPWWPAYKMLLEWKNKLPEEEHGQFFPILAEAIQSFEE